MADSVPGAVNQVDRYETSIVMSMIQDEEATAARSQMNVKRRKMNTAREGKMAAYHATRRLELGVLVEDGCPKVITYRRQSYSNIDQALSSTSTIDLTCLNHHPWILAS